MTKTTARHFLLMPRSSCCTGHRSGIGNWHGLSHNTFRKAQKNGRWWSRPNLLIDALENSVLQQSMLKHWDLGKKIKNKVGFARTSLMSQIWPL